MNVASLELCKELYELSGWNDTDLAHAEEAERVFLAAYNYGEFGYEAIRLAPAYDLGYLLRKLPEQVTLSCFRSSWRCEVLIPNDIATVSADTPEDAAAKLAIELWKQGVLSREAKS